MGVIEKCIGWILVYPFLGGFFIKNAKRMCICEYVIFGIDAFYNLCFDVKKGISKLLRQIAAEHTARNSKPTLCLQHKHIYTQRKYTEMNAINRIRLVSHHEKQYKKGQSHRSIKFQNIIVVYVTVTIYYFLMFFISRCFWISRFWYHFFLQIFPAKQIKSSKVYFIFLISVFAVFTIDNLNVCHRNFDVNRSHCNCTTFKTEVLDINKIRYNCDEMAEITYPHLD